MFKVICVALITTSALVSCSKDAETLIIDSSQPNGTFTVEKSGSFVDQNAAGSNGTVQVGVDDDGKEFLKFGGDFTTTLATGTVTVYLSTSMDFVADPGAGNPDLKLVGIVNKAGEMYYSLDGGYDDSFTHVILWCGTASIPFGYAQLN